MMSKKLKGRSFPYMVTLVPPAAGPEFGKIELLIDERIIDGWMNRWMDGWMDKSLLNQIT